MYKKLTADILPEKITNLIKNLDGVSDLVESIKKSISTCLYEFAKEEGLKIGLRLYLDVVEKEIVEITYDNYPTPTLRIYLADLKKDGTVSKQKINTMRLETVVLLWRQQRDDKEAYIERRKKISNPLGN